MTYSFIEMYCLKHKLFLSDCFYVMKYLSMINVSGDLSINIK